MLGQLGMLFFNGYIMYSNISEEVARGYLTYILGTLYSYYPLSALLVFIITVLADTVILAITLNILQASITRYKYQQSQAYRTTYYVYHKRHASSTITKYLFKMNDVMYYLRKYIESRMIYIEKLLGPSGRKSRINTSLRSKQHC
jgi:hypothetical protein